MTLDHLSEPLSAVIDYPSKSSVSQNVNINGLSRPTANLSNLTVQITPHRKGAAPTTTHTSPLHLPPFPTFTYPKPHSSTKDPAERRDGISQQR